MSFVRPQIDHPVKRFGPADQPFDGADSTGWHVTLRDEDGELESLAGPFQMWSEAMARYRDLMKGVLP